MRAVVKTVIGNEIVLARLLSIGRFWGNPEGTVEISGKGGVSSLIRNLFLLSATSLFFAGSIPPAGQNNMTNDGSWSGVIINNCTPDEAFAEAAKCTEAGVRGSKLSLYDDTTRQVYVLDPQDQAVGHLGDSVTVSGTIEGNTLHVTSFKMLTAIGLDVGRKAPAFSARDQFGREQSLDSLKGPNGTVLLFFRSADW
jgi:hypothetical protein